MELLLTAFPLLVCALLGVVVHNIANNHTRLALLVSDLARRQAELAVDVAKLADMAPVKLAARVDDIGEALEQLRLTQQKFAGRFYQRQAGHGGNGLPEHVDDEVASLIALQRAPPVRPGE